MMQRTIQDIRERSAVLYCPFPAKKQEFYDRQGLIGFVSQKPSEHGSRLLAVRLY